MQKVACAAEAESPFLRKESTAGEEEARGRGKPQEELISGNSSLDIGIEESWNRNQPSSRGREVRLGRGRTAEQTHFISTTAFHLLFGQLITPGRWFLDEPPPGNRMTSERRSLFFSSLSRLASRGIRCFLCLFERSAALVETFASSTEDDAAALLWRLVADLPPVEAVTEAEGGGLELFGKVSEVPAEISETTTASPLSQSSGWYSSHSSLSLLSSSSSLSAFFLFLFGSLCLSAASADFGPPLDVRGFSGSAADFSLAGGLRK